jgi:hypothetical protein
MKLKIKDGLLILNAALITAAIVHGEFNDTNDQGEVIAVRALVRADAALAQAEAARARADAVARWVFDAAGEMALTDSVIDLDFEWPAADTLGMGK